MSANYLSERQMAIAINGLYAIAMDETIKSDATMALLNELFEDELFFHTMDPLSPLEAGLVKKDMFKVMAASNVEHVQRERITPVSNDIPRHSVPNFIDEELNAPLSAEGLKYISQVVDEVFYNMDGIDAFKGEVKAEINAELVRKITVGKPSLDDVALADTMIEVANNGDDLLGMSNAFRAVTMRLEKDHLSLRGIDALYTMMTTKNDVIALPNGSERRVKVALKAPRNNMSYYVRLSGDVKQPSVDDVMVLAREIDNFVQRLDNVGLGDVVTLDGEYYLDDTQLNEAKQDIQNLNIAMLEMVPYALKPFDTSLSFDNALEKQVSDRLEDKVLYVVSTNEKIDNWPEPTKMFPHHSAGIAREGVYATTSRDVAIEIANLDPSFVVSNRKASNEQLSDLRNRLKGPGDVVDISRERVISEVLEQSQGVLTDEQVSIAISKSLRENGMKVSSSSEEVIKDLVSDPYVRPEHLSNKISDNELLEMQKQQRMEEEKVDMPRMDTPRPTFGPN